MEKPASLGMSSCAKGLRKALLEVVLRMTERLKEAASVKEEDPIKNQIVQLQRQYAP